MQRVHIGDAQGVAHQAAGGRAASRPNRDALRARVMHEIPNDQEVALVAHLLDHFDFRGQPAFVFGQRMAQQALLCQTLKVRNARCKTFPRHLLEIARGIVSPRNLKFRKRIGDALNLYVAAPRDVDRAAERVRNLAENLGHLRGAFEIELVGRKLHAVRVAHGFSRLDAEQDFLGVRVFVMQIVAIVRRD